MAHTVFYSHDYNNFIRQVRSFLKDAPRVKRSVGHEDINNLGVDYKVSGGGSNRAAGDILHISPETTALRKIYRATTTDRTGTTCSFGTTVTPTCTWNIGAKTLIRATGSWATDGFTAGDCIHITNAATAGNNGVRRISTITTTTNANDTITFNASDTVSASDAADVISATAMGGGAILDVRADQAGANTHIGWLCSNLEFVAKDGTLHLSLHSGSSWATGDYAQWEFERGGLSLHENLAMTRKVSFVDGGGGVDTITRKDYNGSFIRDGFVNGGIIEVLGSVSNNGRFLITAAVTAKTITLATGTVTAETNVSCTLYPRQRLTVNFDDADATFAGSPPTIIRSAGSWVTDGYVAGGLIEVQDAVTSGNNGYWEIDSILTDAITNDTLKLVSGSVLVDGTTDVITATKRNTIKQKWTDHRYRWSLTSGTTGVADNDLTAGKLPPVWDADGNYTTEWVGIGPGNDAANNPQTVYCGLQSQFLGSTKHNVELRCFDGVSDSSFSGLLNASPPSYIYLTKSPSMETYLTGDGEHFCGFLDVNTSVTEWFYEGYTDVHGTSGQHPRPIFCGGMGWSSTNSRTTTGSQVNMFTKSQAKSSVSSTEQNPRICGAWFRWVDGTWYAVYTTQAINTGADGAYSQSVAGLHAWPWKPADSFFAVTRPTTGTAFTIDGGNNAGSQGAFLENLKPTPTSLTPNPNREYPLLPAVIVMERPTLNVICDLRDVFCTSNDGQATKNRILRGREVYIVGQNHEKTTAQNWMALHLN